VQQALNDIGWYPALDVDGSYGNETKTAIENFQRNYGLSVDGLAGPETIDALKLAVAAAKGATT
jgi:peptidoglycan hydrolase-like protein with peptidoglycan-binding domain